MAPPKPRWILVAAVCLAGIAGAAIWAWHIRGVRRQVAESTSHQPVPFTELSFTDPVGLPKHLSRTGPNEFGFTIANHEAKPVVYSYLVTARSALGESTISRGSVTVVDEGRVVVPEQFTPPEPGTAYLITVQLLGRPESIHFTATS